MFFERWTMMVSWSFYADFISSWIWCHIWISSTGWYYGERTRDGTQGWFPGNYTEEIHSAHVRSRNLKQRHRLLLYTATYLEAQKDQPNLKKKWNYEITHKLLESSWNLLKFDLPKYLLYFLFTHPQMKKWRSISLSERLFFCCWRNWNYVMW